ncbi:hypothetical protein G6700_05105 [Polynucleobacter paneuropaeus]|nr:hypothetical protein G6700_05105 [Polynucleobacter paneuropaeus]
MNIKEFNLRFIPSLALASCIAFLLLIGYVLNLSKAEWATWIQSFGSVGAIVAALWAVNYQNTKEVKLQAEITRQAQRRQLNVINWVFITIASTCSKCADRVGLENINWGLEAESIEEVREYLLSIPPSEIPDAALVVRSIELSQALKRVFAVVSALSTPRSKEIQEAIIGILNAAKEDALIGSTEASKLKVNCSTSLELQNDFKMIDLRNEHRIMMLETLSELKGASQAAL